MANFILVSIFLAAVAAAAHGASGSRPKPGMLSGAHSLGMVMPQLSGWGSAWGAPTTTLPPATTGWPAPETTTAAPEITTGWPALPETTTGWPAVPETTTGWPAPETTTGWPAPETTTTGWIPPPTTPGWSPPPTTPGWSPPPTTTGWVAPVNIEMQGESAVLGSGESGATHGSQTSVSGDASNPAIAVINTGSYSSLGQGSGVLQISSVNSNGESNTFQGLDGYNFGDSGESYGGSISGNQINTLNGGGSFVLGQGVIGQGGFTLNNNALPPIPPNPFGWRE